MRVLVITVTAALAGCLGGAREDASEVEEPLVFGCAWEDGGVCDPFPAIAECGQGIHTTETLVIDTQPPEIVDAWDPMLPADDRMHRIEPSDCVAVRDACSPTSHVFFTSVTSDEPVLQRETPYDFQPVDVMSIGCEAVDLRAYASPRGNGRVYELGWRAVDALGHTLDGTCFVHVPVLPDSPAVQDAAAYTIDLTRSCMPL